MYFNTYLRFRKKFKAGRGATQALSDELVEPSMLVQQRNSLQQLQDAQRNWEHDAIQAALSGQERLHQYKPISSLISLLESKKAERAKTTYQDRGAAHFKKTYNNEQSRALAKVGLFRDQPMPFIRDQLRQATEQHLDSVLAEKDCGRSELIRNAQLPDLFLSDLPDGWVKPGCSFKADVIAKDNGKTNHDGHHEFHGALRDARHLASDCRTAVALHLYHMLIVEGLGEQLLEDFKPRPEFDEDGITVLTVRPWMDWYLIAGRTSAGRANVFSSTSGATQRTRFKAAATAAGIELNKGQATHARRHRALQANTSTATSRQAKARYGGWQEGMGRMERHYESQLSYSIMAGAGGHPTVEGAGCALRQPT